jgi:hypothetical protein
MFIGNIIVTNFVHDYYQRNFSTSLTILEVIKQNSITSAEFPD